MIKLFKVHSLLVLLERTIILGLIVWTVVATILLVRLKPQTLLIGIDAYGTRLITNEDDKLLTLERINFIKRFISYVYNYSSLDFDTRISIAGDMMTQTLWEEKKGEFLKLLDGLKNEDLTQKTKIIEIREVDSENFEADLNINVITKLKETTVKLRVQLKIKKTNRTNQNPYPYEVENYVEDILS